MNSLWIRFVALTIALALAAPLRADEPAPLPVAVINMDRVFTKYKPFQDKLAPLREAAQELGKRVQLRQIELETVVTQLRNAQPGSPEAQRLQQQAAKLNNDLQQFVQKEQGDLQKRESKAALEFYRQVEDEVRKYAKSKGIKLVIRQQENSLDENQPVAEILKSVNRAIIYEEQLDITDEILKALDARNATDSKKDR